MRIGYARSLISGGSLEWQKQQLQGSDCERIYADVGAADNDLWLELDDCLLALQYGDTLVVCSTDRLSRNIDDYRKIERDLEERGVIIEVLESLQKDF